MQCLLIIFICQWSQWLTIHSISRGICENEHILLGQLFEYNDTLKNSSFHQIRRIKFIGLYYDGEAYVGNIMTDTDG